MKYTILTVLLFGFWIQSSAQNAGSSALATVSGTVKDASNGESLYNAAVVVEAGGKKYSVLTNTYGNFSLTTIQGPVTITVSSLGYIQQSGKYTLVKSNSLVFKLKPSVVDLDEVTVGVEEESTP